MAKPKLSPREKKVFSHFDSKHIEFVEELQELEGTVSEVIDILYLDTVIGTEKESIDGRVGELEDALIGVVKALENHKKKNQKTRQKLIIR